MNGMLAVLKRYSEGGLTRKEALEALRCEPRHYPHLLRLLGQAGLPLPAHPDADAMADDFAEIWQRT